MYATTHRPIDALFATSSTTARWLPSTVPSELYGTSPATSRWVCTNANDCRMGMPPSKLCVTAGQ